MSSTVSIVFVFLEARSKLLKMQAGGTSGPVWPVRPFRARGGILPTRSSPSLNDRLHRNRLHFDLICLS